MRDNVPLEGARWAKVSRVEHAGQPARRYDICYPPQEDEWYSELERDALGAAVAAARLRDPRLRTWLEVGDTWALEQDSDGLEVSGAWRLAARVRPHDVKLAWRDPGSMADATYAVSARTPSGQWTRRLRKGPWDPGDAIKYPDRSRHRTVRVQRAPIRPRYAARVVVEAGRAVARLHAAGMVHGMLTTNALAISRAGQVVVHRIATYACELRATMYTGSGHPGRFYADVAPELVESFDHASVLYLAPTPASDVFELASVLYELLAFSPAWMRATSNDSLVALRSETLPPISSIHAEAAPLDAILTRAFSRDPSVRPSIEVLVATVDAAFVERDDDRAELARIVADAMTQDAQVASLRDLPM